MTKLQEIEDALMQHPDPVVSVPELANEIDRSDTHIRDKLEKLEYLDRVERKDVGARATAWWHVDRVTPPHLPAEDHPDQSDLESAADSQGGHSAESDGPEWTVEEAAGVADLPGQGDKEMDRRDALEAVLRHLRDAGETRAGELESFTFEQFETHYSGERSWWKNAASPALSQLDDLGAVELRDQSRGLWAWTGSEQ